MYQKCPKCNGEGKIEVFLSLFSVVSKTATCPVCRGESIIHQESGLPPSVHNVIMLGEESEELITNSKEFFEEQISKTQLKIEKLEKIIKEAKEIKEADAMKKSAIFKCFYSETYCPYIIRAEIETTKSCHDCEHAKENKLKKPVFINNNGAV